MKKLTEVMIDLETLDTTPTSVIVSIGAASFYLDGDKIESKFEDVVDMKSCIDLGGTISPDTIKWWMLQSKEARDAAFTGSRSPIKQVLKKFYVWMSYQGNPRVWANGADFDLPIVRFYYQKLGLKCPWDFRNQMCFRTIKNLYPKVDADKIPYSGVNHSAVDDAIRQAHYLMCLKRL